MLFGFFNYTIFYAYKKEFNQQIHIFKKNAGTHDVSRLKTWAAALLEFKGEMNSVFFQVSSISSFNRWGIC